MVPSGSDSVAADVVSEEGSVSDCLFSSSILLWMTSLTLEEDQLVLLTSSELLAPAHEVSEVNNISAARKQVTFFLI